MDTINLLKTNGGLVLGCELCIRVAEHVLHDDPKAAASLMRLSKSFQSLLSSYEGSISKNVTRLQQASVEVNQQCDRIAFSIPNPQSTFSNTYSWLSEVSFRRRTAVSLIDASIPNIQSIYQARFSETGSKLADANGPSEKAIERERRLAFRGVELLYKLVDSVAGLHDVDEVRRIQVEVIRGMSTVNLALVAGVVMDFKHTYQVSQGLADSSNDPYTRELLAVFEARVMRWGPYFAWAALGLADASSKAAMWADDEMHHGFREMRAYEMGAEKAYCGLQSVVWRLLCERFDCEYLDVWDETQRFTEGLEKLGGND